MRNFEIFLKDSQKKNVTLLDINNYFNNNNNIKIIENFYDNISNIINKSDTEISILISFLYFFQCNYIKYVAINIKERYKKEKLTDFLIQYNINNKEIITYLNCIKIITWKEYDEDEFIDENIFEEIIYIYKNENKTYYNYYNEDVYSIYYEYCESYEFKKNNINFSFDYEINKIQGKYSELMQPTLNKNFKGFSSNQKMDSEKFRSEFNYLVSKFELMLTSIENIKQDLWRLILGIPNNIHNNTDFIYFICSLLHNAKNKKILDIYFIFINNELNDTLSNQICDLLYNNFNIRSFEDNLYKILEPI